MYISTGFGRFYIRTFSREYNYDLKENKPSEIFNLLLSIPKPYHLCKKKSGWMYLLFLNKKCESAYFIHAVG